MLRFARMGNPDLIDQLIKKSAKGKAICLCIEADANASKIEYPCVTHLVAINHADTPLLQKTLATIGINLEHIEVKTSDFYIPR